MKTPLQKSVEGYIITPDAVVVVIDGDRLEREVLKGSIKDSDVTKLLPFQTTNKIGTTQIHIVNESAYTVETDSHNIREGESLCSRIQEFSPISRTRVTPTCPGCLIKAKNIIVNHLYATEGIIR